MTCIRTHNHFEFDIHTYASMTCIRTHVHRPARCNPQCGNACTCTSTCMYACMWVHAVIFSHILSVWNTYFNTRQKSEANRSQIEQAGAIMCSIVSLLARNGYVPIHDARVLCLFLFCSTSVSTHTLGPQPMHTFIMKFSNTHAFTRQECPFTTHTVCIHICMYACTHA